MVVYIPVGEEFVHSHIGEQLVHILTEEEVALAHTPELQPHTAAVAAAAAVEDSRQVVGPGEEMLHQGADLGEDLQAWIHTAGGRRELRVEQCWSQEVGRLGHMEEVPSLLEVGHFYHSFSLVVL